MFGWRSSRNRPQVKPTLAAARPVTFRPQLEPLEGRWLPSTGTLSSGTGLAGQQAALIGQAAQPQTAAPSTTLVETVHGHQTAWHLVVDAIIPVYATTFAGTVSGTLPGTFTATFRYRGEP